MTPDSKNDDGQNTVEAFYRHFQDELSALQEQIEQLEQYSTTGGERRDAVEHCSAGIVRLTAEVRDVIDSLPAHDRQSYSDALKALSTKFQNAKGQLTRKQKFSFKSSAFKVPKSESAILLHHATTLEEKVDAQSTDSPDAEMNKQLGLSGVRDQVLTFDANQQLHELTRDVHGSVLALRRADETFSRLRTLQLRDISQSVIACPSVDGPVHLTNISRSVIIVECRQFRMHDSVDCEVYLHCTSRPIIENCQGIRFAPLDSMSSAGTENLWDQVDDFKWLKAQQSPNWSIVPLEQRLSSETIDSLSHVKADAEVKDLLRTFRIPT